MSEELKRTQLYQWHADHGARLVPFAGWEMPVQYPTGPIEEHHITRRSAGLFDIDHMGQITISGPDDEAYLNHLVTWDIGLMKENEAHYAIMCYDNSTIIDDVFIYKLPKYWFVVVNADNLAKDYEWMMSHIGTYDVTVTDVSPETYMLALQGPKAIELLQSLTTNDMNDVPRFTAAHDHINDVPVIIGRTGYTGEDGVELFFSAIEAVNIWETILAAGQNTGIEVAPIGLAARDSLRFEPAFALYGHEIDENTTPLEANLGWACKFESEFIGKTALLQQKEKGLTKKLVGFELTQKGVPRQGYPVATEQGEVIGEVVTGLYAPTVDKYCGHAYVKPEYAKVDTPIQVLIRNKPKNAIIIKRPFYVPAYRK
ncbi:MAG: glycine cleavage system aminomethyltransferase GcvT [Chloroflexota bacterium]